LPQFSHDTINRYLSIDHFIAEETHGNDDVFVINNLFRAWGHQFIYDEQTLRNSLEKAGFKNIVRCDLGQSSKTHLQKIENESRLPLGSFQPETLTLEGESWRIARACLSINYLFKYC
jgi:hypothetical protein